MGLDPISAVSGLVQSVVERIWPDPTKAAEFKAKIAELTISGELQKMTLEYGLLQGQLDINKQEAASPSLFIAGWRPFVGWLCGGAFAYAVVITPFMEFVARLSGYNGAFPVIDTAMTMQVLMGMLGMAALRSFDKTKGNGNGQ